ncbi:NAD(P)-binding protein [Thozetella sp. PMI_491]|nr:NAD(P)-binding protein [Thozetella sp. PMI_491]
MDILRMVFTPTRGFDFDATRDIPSLEGRVILVTGATSGLGRQSVLELARHSPARIFLGARDPAKAAATIQEIQKLVTNAPPMHSLTLDLTSLASVRAAAEAFIAQAERLDILMLNAGIVFSPPTLTQDGYELRFGTNYMGHALLTRLLLPTLLQTAAQPRADVRVVVVSSSGITWTPPGGIDFACVKTSGEGVGVWRLYGQSKLASGLLAQELARRYPQLKIACVHPGTVATDLPGPVVQNNIILRTLWPIVPPFLATVEQGARNQLWAATADEVVSGEFYVPVGVVGTLKGVDKVKDKELANRLWEWTEEEFKRHLE